MIQSEMAKMVRAAYFAGEKHKDQRRSDKEETPYINHPLELASILVDEGFVEDVNVICAALLHDTIEDTDTTFDELESIFGPVVTSIVREVSNDMTLSSVERRQKEAESIPGLSHRAKLVAYSAQTGHSFHGKLITDSTANWTVNPDYPDHFGA